MANMKQYDQLIEEQVIIKMFQTGLTATDKSKIVRARKFPSNVAKSFDLFKTYFLSKEGLKPIFAKLSEEEIVMLHILHFNKWIVDVSFFEAIYVEMPKAQKYYYSRGTFTQQYGSLLKIVKTQLVQKGILVQYEDEHGGNAKAERQRFMIPSALGEQLPPPFFKLKKMEGRGLFSDEKIRELLQKAVKFNAKKGINPIELNHKKLQIKQKTFSLEQLAQIQIRSWRLDNSALILTQKFREKGKTLANFVLHHLQELPNNQWLNAESVRPLLKVWEDHKKRYAHQKGNTYRSPYDLKDWCDVGWKSGLLQKKTEKGKVWYRFADEPANLPAFEQYLEINERGLLTVDLNTIPLSILVDLAQMAVFQSSSTPIVSIEPDLVNVAEIDAQLLEKPLAKWLNKNAPPFKQALAFFKKNHGKQIVHDNLLVAKITDLSLRVLVERGLEKSNQVVVLSDEYIAFPKKALPTVERIVTKSGNVIKHRKN